MAKRAILSRKTYWPNSGDMLENHNDGIVWEYVRANAHYDDVTGEKIRYGLFLGRSNEFEEPIVMVVHDRDGKAWLNGIDVIERKVQGGKTVAYTYDEVSDNWKA